MVGAEPSTQPPTSPTTPAYPHYYFSHTPQPLNMTKNMQVDSDSSTTPTPSISAPVVGRKRKNGQEKDLTLKEEAPIKAPKKARIGDLAKTERKLKGLNLVSVLTHKL